jgi:hypothetical protein
MEAKVCDICNEFYLPDSGFRAYSVLKKDWRDRTLEAKEMDLCHDCSVLLSQFMSCRRVQYKVDAAKRKRLLVDRQKRKQIISELSGQIK